MTQIYELVERMDAGRVVKLLSDALARTADATFNKNTYSPNTRHDMRPVTDLSFVMGMAS